MPKRNSKGRFVKSKALARRTRTRTVTKTRRVYVQGARRRGRGRRRSAASGGMKLVPLAVTAAGLGFVLGENSPMPSIRQQAMKIPGAKTFGPEATVGAVCLAVNKFVKPNKWLRLAGIVGVTIGALKLGNKGEKFQWLGDDDDVADIEGDDDVADYEE